MNFNPEKKCKSTILWSHIEGNIVCASIRQLKVRIGILDICYNTDVYVLNRIGSHDISISWTLNKLSFFLFISS